MTWTERGRALGAPLLLALLIPAFAGAARVQRTKPPDWGRSVHGVVLDARNRPLSSALVYLTNLRTKAVKTAITDTQGAYSFHELTPQVDYRLVAAWHGHKSPSRTDSEYEIAHDLRLDLTVPVE
ncbi:MAG TPA: carboxypeptidase-like regulatory domain-containing protein [Terriglobales bacterium]|nr:carboxypeptidase-like regulatory domain-containing protein [Terriglobales bacterium]